MTVAELVAKTKAEYVGICNNQGGCKGDRIVDKYEFDKYEKILYVWIVGGNK